MVRIVEVIFLSWQCNDGSYVDYVMRFLSFFFVGDWGWRSKCSVLWLQVQVAWWYGAVDNSAVM